MVSSKTVQSLVIFFGPLLLPKAIGYYRSIRSRPRSQIKPLPPKTCYALTVLFFTGLVAFLSTLPVFVPTNIFRLTQSRLGTQAGVLLTRLAALRPVTPADERLRRVLDAGGLEARLLYARFGPRVLEDCPYAKPNEVDANWDYLVYATPSILAPHLLHLLALGVTTSRILSGPEGARWRTIATVAGLLLGVVEYYLIATYDSTANARSTRVNDIEFLYWKLHVYRGLAIAAVDGVLGWVIWLQATGRAFLAPPSTSERIDGVGTGLEAVLGKVRSLGTMRNAIVRNASMRRKADEYWVKEGEVMKDVFEQPEVLEAQRNALKRIDVTRLQREVDGYMEGLFANVLVKPGGPVQMHAQPGS